jgi:hypothetical protein
VTLTEASAISESATVTEARPSATTTATQILPEEPGTSNPIGDTEDPVILAMPPGMPSEAAALSDFSEVLSANTGLVIEANRATSVEDGRWAMVGKFMPRS